ncbi:rod shape-determining protein MreC [Nocardioides szechwanensis]|uniref:Cell shape-determining protein MreC n=1 Tax=Nocardioides szechwanensis TaxID=1005944 RepID=A0A1H0LKA1_9ACTN|nr:rod shape-determining protein MreC [Nocardioides szechwanensis]GEP36257.1 rod shape-determining protein MreC [Nocardioides szechwanensis]SDO68637.1 rod shape-determining protein MreC [Nocardioides szechwanensis]
MRPDPTRERRWRPTGLGASGGSGRHGQPPRGLVVALLLACATLITLDYQGGNDSPVEPVRRVMGEVYGPVEVGVATAIRPVVSIPRWLRSQDSMRDEIDDLEAQNAELRQQVNTAGYDRNKLAEYDGLTAAAGSLGYALVPARVVGLGPSQSFSSTVTIDAGSRAGLRPDMTVVNNDGLVGRVLRVTRTTATVLLVIDADSVVGGRVGESMEIGMLHGRGVLGDEGRLDLELIDTSVVPNRGDTVVTWGSESGAPYVAGVPVGRIETVFSNVRDGSQRAVIAPFVDFGALDLVGVVVPSGTDSDRAVVEADGSIR